MNKKNLSIKKYILHVIFVLLVFFLIIVAVCLFELLFGINKSIDDTRSIKGEIVTFFSAGGLRTLWVFVIFGLLFYLTTFLLIRLNRRINDEFNTLLRFFNAVEEKGYPDITYLADLKIHEFKGIAKHIDLIIKGNGTGGINVKTLKSLYDRINRIDVVLNSVSESIFRINNRKEIVMMNKKAEYLTGVKSVDGIGKNVDDVIVLNDEVSGKRIFLSERIDLYLNDVKNYIFSGIAIVISKFGKRRLVNYTINRIVKEGDKSAGGVVLVLKDIASLLKRNREIENIKKLESLGVLAGGIAHDFNNLFTSIYGNISLAKMFIDRRDKSIEYLKEAEKTMDIAVKLTGHLITFSRGGMPQKELINIAKVIEDIAGGIFKYTDVEYSISSENGLYSLMADPIQIKEVISNLLENAKTAVLFTSGQGNKGTVNISIRNFNNKGQIKDLDAGRYILIEIEDNGCGISTEVMDRIFDPYFTTWKGSSGLGLSITYSIVKRHKGFIQVESKMNRGTNFKVYFPAVNGKSVGEKERNIITKSSGSECLKILVMDDDKIISRMLGEMIQTMGYEVDIAANGEEAVDKYKDALSSGRGFDLVIMDLVVVEGMGGLEALKLIKEIDPGANVIASSGYSMDPVVSDYKKYGFSGIMLKPFKMEDLKNTIYSIFGSKDR